MTRLETILRIVVVGLASVVVATGCATAKQTPQAATAAAAPAPAPAPAPAEAVPGDVHVVQAGECLWCISEKITIYADPYQWPLIYAANPQIKDADLIYPGQELSIRRDMSGDEIVAARNHARTRGAWTLGVVEDSDVQYRAMAAGN